MKSILKGFFIVISLIFLFGCEMPSQNEKKHVQYIIDNEVVVDRIVDIDEVVEEPSIPEKVGKYEWILTESVKEDGTKEYIYTLEYSVQEFCVIFYGLNREQLQVSFVKYGEAATAPVLDDRYIVTWDKDFSCVTSFLQVYCTVECKYYYVEFYDGTTKLDLGIDVINPNESIDLPNAPYKEGYEFLGWYNSDISLYEVEDTLKDVRGDTKLYARYARIDYSKEELPNAPYHFTGVMKSNDMYLAILPSGVDQSRQNYIWTTSDQTYATVSSFGTIFFGKPGYFMITATNKENPTVVINGYFKATLDSVELISIDELKAKEAVTVTFKGMNEEVIKEYQIIEGGNIVYPLPPVIDGFKFVGWDLELYTTDQDVVINAVYEEGYNEFNGKKFAVIGDSISTYNYLIPSGYSYFYPYANYDIHDFNQTWWMRTINALGGGLFINNSYSGSCVASGASSDSQNIARLQKLILNGEAPDYVMIFMGSNDVGGNISVQKFKVAYKKMITQILELAPDTKLILMTLPQSKYYTLEEQKPYNQIIRDYAEEYDQILVELENLDIKTHCIDSAHPANSGMVLMANAILSQLLK